MRPQTRAKLIARLQVVLFNLMVNKQDNALDTISIYLNNKLSLKTYSKLNLTEIEKEEILNAVAIELQDLRIESIDAEDTPFEETNIPMQESRELTKEEVTQYITDDLEDIYVSVLRMLVSYSIIGISDFQKDPKLIREMVDGFMDIQKEISSLKVGDYDYDVLESIATSCDSYKELLEAPLTHSDYIMAAHYK